MKINNLTLISLIIILLLLIYGIIVYFTPEDKYNRLKKVYRMDPYLLN